MRAMWLSLLGVGLLAAVSQLAAPQGGPRAEAATRATLRKGHKPDERVVDGYGRTPSAARQVALENAQARVEELLRRRYGPNDWKPAEDQLRPEYLTEMGVIRDAGEPSVTEVGGERVVVARMEVDLTPRYLDAVQRVARQQRVQERQAALGRVLAGLVVAFLVVAGYLRLEEATRGYYTRLLRLAAVALVAAAAVALWLSF
jgi:hypothetical protein